MDPWGTPIETATHLDILDWNKTLFAAAELGNYSNYTTSHMMTPESQVDKYGANE